MDGVVWIVFREQNGTLRGYGLHVFGIDRERRARKTGGRQVAHEPGAGFAMDVARFRWHLRGRSKLDVGGSLPNGIAARRFDLVVALVRREQSGASTDLRLLDSLRLRDLLCGIALVGRVHDVDPDRKCDLASECAPVNFLRFIEPGPDGAGNGMVVTRKESVGKIVSCTRFSRSRELVQAKLLTRGVAGARFERFNQTRMD